MTALILYRIPRRWLRKFFKPAALWLNTMRIEHSEMEVARLQLLRAALAEAEGAQHIRQVKLMHDRRAVEGW